MEQLQKYRNIIDKLDSEIIILIAKRIGIAKKIARFKQNHKISRLDKKRFREILKSRSEQAQLNKIDPKLIKNIFKQIHQFVLNIKL